jgi:hypothetical protein
MKKQILFQTKYSKKLEDLFFLKQDAILMEEFHRMEQMKETKESLAKVSGITNDEILQKFVDLDIRPDIMASLALIPLIEAAWADGSVDEKEKAAVLEAAAKSFFAKDSIDFKLLSQWLEHRPPHSLLDAWTHYIEGLCEKLTAAQKSILKNELIGHARQIAQAAGGFLGLGNKISDEERRVLDYLESAFD